MIPCWEIDIDGNIVEHYNLSELELEYMRSEGRIIVDFPWEDGLIAPIKFIDGEWVSAATEEEIDAILNPPEVIKPPTNEELQVENEELKSRLESAEMAIITLMDFM